MNRIILSILFLLLIFSCGQKKNSIVENHLEMKIAKFDPKLIDHFPRNQVGNNQSIVVSENVRKNNIGVLLYEYDMGERYIDSLINIYKKNSIAQYKNSDSCLLVINKFETPKTYSDSEDIFIDFEKRKNEVNLNCYEKKLPIPKFLDYRFINNASETCLNNNFEFYILEANNKDFFRKFDLVPNSQMPDNWSNGFSKGIAISKKDRCVIFWGVIW
ncbi:hypothetical protein [Chryseobacterium sp. CT-SW4]|uniref:hypothetical protein n=1 Tax=Chryseobacterium sp. SW-1 TaxID=3157343 RepID=UPI003B0299A6